MCLTLEQSPRGIQVDVGISTSGMSDGLQINNNIGMIEPIEPIEPRSLGIHESLHMVEIVS